MESAKHKLNGETGRCMHKKGRRLVRVPQVLYNYSERWACPIGVRPRHDEWVWSDTRSLASKACVVWLSVRTGHEAQEESTDEKIVGRRRKPPEPPRNNWTVRKHVAWSAAAWEALGSGGDMETRQISGHLGNSRRSNQITALGGFTGGDTDQGKTKYKKKQTHFRRQQ